MQKTNEVELAIRARDEFSRTFKEFESALDGVKSSLKQTADRNAEQGAARLDAQYRELTETLRKLREEQANDKAALAAVKSLRAQETSLARLNDRLEKNRLAHENASAAAAKARATQQGVTDGQQARLTNTARAVERLSREYADLEAVVAGARGELDRAGINTRDLVNEQLQLQSRVDGSQKQIRELAGTLSRYSAVSRQTATDTVKAAQAQKLFSTETRRALNVTQRLRGQILATLSAYVGLFGIANEIRNVFNVAAEEERSRVRFGVAADGDEQIVAAQMRFVRSEAERLKTSYVTLASEYSRFVAALPPGALALEDQQRIMSAYTVAARVSGASNEQIQRTFLALTQIISKGTLSMEELRQQLSEGIGGIIPVFAEGMGYAKDQIEEFYAAVAAGDIDGLEAVLNSVDPLLDKFGGGLEEALKAPAATFSDFARQLEELRLQVSRSGFLDDVVAALKDATEALKEEDTKQALKDFGSFLGAIIRQLPALIPYLDEFAWALGLLVGVGLTRYLFNAGRGLKDFTGWVVGLVSKTGAVRGFFAVFRNQDRAMWLLVDAAGALAGAYDGLLGLLPALITRLKSLNLTLAGIAKAFGVLTVAAWAFNKVSELLSTKGEATELYYAGIEKIGKAIDIVKKENRDGLFRNLEAKSEESLERLLETIKQRTPEIEAALLAAQVNLSGIQSGLFIDDIERVETEISLLETQLRRYATITAEVRESLQFRAAADLQSSNAITETEDSINALSEALLSLTEQNTATRIAAINTAFEQAQQGVDQTSQKYAELEAVRAQALISAEAARQQQVIQLRSEETARKLDLLQKEGLKADELQQKQRQLITELNNHRIAETERGVQGVARELDRARATEQRLADRVAEITRSISDERARQASVERGFRREGLSDIAAFYDRRRELAEIALRTERLLEQGKFEAAIESARKQEALATDLRNTEIVSERTGKTLVTQASSRARFTKEVLKAHEQINRAQAQQRQEAEAAAAKQRELTQALVESLDALNTSLNDLLGEQFDINAQLNDRELVQKLDELRARARDDGISLLATLDSERAQAQLAQLTRPETKEIKIRLVLDRFGIPRAVRDVLGFKDGGLVLPGFADGGRVRGPGTSRSDSILARLSNGEFVMRADAVRHWGDGFFRDLNALRFPNMPIPAFASGGPVRATGSPARSGRVDRVALDLTINNQPVGAVTGDRNTIDALISGLSELSR